MRISIGTTQVETTVWQTDDDMVASVRRYKKNIILGRQSSDTLVGSFVCHFGLWDDNDKDFAVGVRWIHGAFAPVMVASKHGDADRIYVTFDNECVALSPVLVKIEFTLSFQTYIRSIFVLEPIGALVVEEAGLSLVSPQGERQWSILKDVITDIRQVGPNLLNISFMDSPGMVVDLRTGEAVG